LKGVNRESSIMRYEVVIVPGGAGIMSSWFREVEQVAEKADCD
jgi:hypothetical protein